MSIVLQSVSVKRQDKLVLEDISVTFRPGYITGLIGPNGSGKSTLLRAMYDYLPCHSGTVTVQDKVLSSWNPYELSRYLGVCSQQAEESLDFSVEQALSLRFGGHLVEMKKRLPKLGFLRLSELFGRRLSELSGGERQRVRLGQTLLSEAPWLLLDEPANHLDLATAWSLYEYLTRQAELGGVIVAMHDLSMACRICTELLVLKSGKLVGHGDAKSSLTPDLLGTVFNLEAELQDWNGRPSLNITGVLPGRSAGV